MRYLFLLLIILSACSVSETGEIEASLCPDCMDAYDGFDFCAFFDSDWPKDTFLVDDENFKTRGIPIAITGYMHHKFCFNETHAVFGSANPTDTGLGLNDNLVVTVESAVMADNFRQEYLHLIGQSSGKHTQTWTFNNQEITHLFCPRDACEDNLIKELEDATESIVFLTFSFTSHPVADTLIDKHQDICITGVVESRGATASYAIYPKLREHHIPVFRVQTPGVMHHKAFLIDNTTAIIGSYNPSKNANTNNAETLVFIQEEAVVQAINTEYRRLVGKYPCKRF